MVHSVQLWIFIKSSFPNGGMSNDVVGFYCSAVKYYIIVIANLPLI